MGIRDGPAVRRRGVELVGVERGGAVLGGVELACEGRGGAVLGGVELACEGRGGAALGGVRTPRPSLIRAPGLSHGGGAPGRGGPAGGGEAGGIDQSLPVGSVI